MPRPATYAALTALMDQRRSCRAFLKTPVHDSAIRSIVATAQKVPSWCNAQPWQLIVTRPATTRRFARHMTEAAERDTPRPDIPFPRAYEGVYRDRRRACGWQLYEAVGVARGDRQAAARQMMENTRFFGAPHVAIVTSDRALGEYGLIDCGAFVTAFMLAARSLGIDSIAQAALAAHSPAVRAFFDIPEDRLIVCGIAFGHADRDHPANSFRTDRAEPDEVIAFR